MTISADGTNAFGEVSALIEGGRDDGEFHSYLMGAASPREWDDTEVIPPEFRGGR
jgi:hypothetical protein